MHLCVIVRDKAKLEGGHVEASRSIAIVGRTCLICINKHDGEQNEKNKCSNVSYYLGNTNILYLSKQDNKLG